MVESITAKIIPLYLKSNLEKAYATNALVNITSMTPEEPEAYYAEQAAIYASYLADYIEK